MTDKKPIGLYIHIPFCRSKCPYCDFYSFIPNGNIINDYKEAVIREIEEKNPLCDTVYFGGGTPSFAGEKTLCEILSHIRKAESCEITVECNPADTGREEYDFDFSALAKAGVNRISMGLQSGIESERKALGRLSGCDEISRAISRAKKAGIENISLDLMLGIPGQTKESLQKSIDFCASSGAKHISAYILKIEDETYFGKHREKLVLPDEDETCDLYLQAVKSLEEYGFKQYEISNFAFPGFESRHNLKYWHLEDYLGIGPAAHSFIGGKRFYRERDIYSFIKGEKPVPDGTGGDCEEYIMLSLRLAEGLSFDILKEKYNVAPGNAFFDYAKKLSENSLINLTDEGLSLTPRGFLISNSIITELIERLIP